MGDIVWAINPKRDRVGDLLQRMRHFASDTLHRDGTSTSRSARPTRDGTCRWPPMCDAKSCSSSRKPSTISCGTPDAAAPTSTSGSSETDWSLQVADDGQGLPTPSSREDGHGLLSMRERARAAERRAWSVETRARAAGRRLVLRVPWRQPRTAT